MGLLDSVVGALGAGGGEGGQGGLAQLVMQFIQSQPGGLQGLVEQFTKAGFGEQMQSWVGTGANLPIGANDLHGVLSKLDLGSILSQFGLTPGSEKLEGLAQLLPQVVDKMTPNGVIEAGGGDAGGGLAGALGGLLGKLGN
jgi:uncharacterized protein YidB (DUF937 family)